MKLLTVALCLVISTAYTQRKCNSKLHHHDREADFNLNLDLNYFENYKAKLNQVSKSTIQNALINSIDFNNISTISVGKTIE